MKELSVIIVSYNTRELLRECLKSVEAAVRGLDAEVFVVDNASRDGSAGMVRREFPGVILHALDDNVGFAAANNVALERFRGRYAMMLNPDTLVRPGAFEAMMRFMDAHPRCGCLGPRLVGPDGRHQPSARGDHTVLDHLFALTGLTVRFPRSRLFGRFHLSFHDGSTERQVDWVCGAAMMIRRETIDQVGLLDGGYFLYYEEADFCRRARAKGWQVWYSPAAEIVHLIGQSAPAQASPTINKEIVRHRLVSRRRYFRKFHSRLAAWAVEAADALFAYLRIVKHSSKKRGDSAARIRASRIILSELRALEEDR